MTIDLYKVYDSELRAEANAKYISAPEFSANELEATARGFRHATLGEINASANSAQWAFELFSWRGGLWVKGTK